MAPTTTVKQVRTAERDRVTAVLGTEQAALNSASAALVAARDAADQAARALSMLEAETSVKRQQIAEPTTSPAQLHQLEQELLTKLVAHAKQASVLAAAQDLVATEDRVVRSASARVDRAKARLAESEAALTQARQADSEANGWRAALAGPDLAAVAADAGSAATASLVTAAATAMAPWAGDPKLYTLLALRLDDAQDEAAEPGRAAARALAALDALRASYAATEGAVVAKAAAFERERDLARRVAEQTEARLAAARATLGRAVAEPGPTTSETTAISTAASALVGTDKAEERERQAHQDRLAERTKLAALEVLSLPRLAADPAFDVPGDAATSAAYTAHQTAAQAVAAPVAPVTAAMQAKIDTWEANIPLRGMDLLAGVLRATATIGEVKALGTGTPDGLAERLDALDDAEDDYTAALSAQNRARVLLEAAGDRAAARGDAADAVRPVSDQRVAAGVRGDA